MLDRQKVETILMRRFPGASAAQIAAAANGIMGLDEEWEEIQPHVRTHADQPPKPECGDSASFAHELDPVGEIRVFRRRLA